MLLDSRAVEDGLQQLRSTEIEGEGGNVSAMMGVASGFHPTKTTHRPQHAGQPFARALPGTRNCDSDNNTMCRETAVGGAWLLPAGLGNLALPPSPPVRSSVRLRSHLQVALVDLATNLSYLCRDCGLLVGARSKPQDRGDKAEQQHT